MADTEPKTNSLSGTRLFKGIPEEKLDKIAKAVKKETFPENAVIFRQDDPGDAFYIIVSGKLRVFRKGEKGVETDLSVLGAGESFGEMALLTDKPRSANVETLEETQLLVLTRDQFNQTLKDDPNVSLAFVKQMSDWLIRDELKIEKEVERQSQAPKISYLDYVVVVGISLLCGIIFNMVNPNKVNLIPKHWSNDPISIVVPSMAAEKQREGKAMFIDARPSSFFTKEHIKGASSIPLPIFDLMYMMEFSEVDRSTDIIIYGSSISMQYDLHVARKLLLRGFKSIMVLKGGLSAWKENGYPVDS